MIIPSSLLVTIINFLAALIFAMLGVGAAPVFIPTIQSLGYSLVVTVFPLAILLNGINSDFAMIPFAKARSVDWRMGTVISIIAAIFASLVHTSLLTFLGEHSCTSLQLY